MLTDKLFEKVLIAPAKSGADRLYVVSGYATPSMVYKHFYEKGMGNFQVSLIIGMSSIEGIARAYHQEFKDLAQRDYKGRFECWYMTKLPPVHSKAYGWFAGNKPRQAFAGSANYTQNAFMEKQREVMVDADPAEVLSYFRSLLSESINCLDSKVERVIKLVDIERRRTKVPTQPTIVASPRLLPVVLGDDAPAVRVSLLDNKGQLPQRSGLNWGQRPEYRRNPDQAYIRLSSDVYTQKFFPPRGKHFTIVTDDGQTFDAVIAQDRGKAIETHFDNAFLGRYFRQRLGLASGSRVELSHLTQYGRTDIDFMKIDDETYYLDFSV